MCGRCRCTLRPDDVPRACYLRDNSVRQVDTDRYRPSYNVSPGSYLPVLRRESGEAEGHTVHCMKWGLVPSFTKKDEKPDHFKMFNARSESICEKPSFRRLISNRCLVAVEGFYEWKKGPKKQPYYIHFKDDRPLVFAALYDSWKNAEGEVLYTFTILTTDSSSALQWLHDRMPVILGDEASADLWLNGSSDSKLSSVFKPYEEPDLAWYPVTPAMGKASLDGPECIKEIALKSEGQPITKFFSKKGSKDDKESNKPVKTGLQGDVKEGSETGASLEVCSSAHPETKLDMEMKRNYQQLLSEESLSKPSIGEVGKLPPTPVKKKKKKEEAKLKSGPEKQVTLRSYFGKS